MIGILCAMREELEPILEYMKVKERLNHANNIYYLAEFEGKDIVLAYSKIGKVNAAMTATVMIEKFKIKNSIMVCPLYHKLDDEDIEYYKEKYKVDAVVSGGLLGTTNEYIKLPNDVCAQYQGRSSFGRVFLQSHQTAGWIDAGFMGKITLEIVAYDKPVILYKNQRIGQLIFSKTISPATVGYCDRASSKYGGQNSVMPSLLYREV